MITRARSRRRPTTSRRERRLHPGWWALILVSVIAAFITATGLGFTGALVRAVPVTLTSDRAGLVMEVGGKVKLHGIQVGRVASVSSRPNGVSLQLDLYPEQIKYIPANVEGQIRASTVFGAKFVDLVYPVEPDAQRIGRGAVIVSRNVTTEINTVFQNLTSVLEQVQPDKLNAVLTALAQAFAGKGQQMGEAISAGSNVTGALTERIDTLAADLESMADVGDIYAAASPDIIASLSSLSTTASTISRQSQNLDGALLAAIGLSDSGIDLLGRTKDDFVHAVNTLPATTALLAHYRPSFTCTLQGAYWLLYDAGGLETNGRSNIVDSSVLGFAADPYRFPENLPKIAAKGGPDGKPGCNGLPRVDQNMPVRYLVADTGYGTGMDIRPNPGIAHPWFINYFPTTKAVPEPPRIYGEGPPAIGPVPYPGAPPYGAPLFGSDGAPLWAPPPLGAPPPPVPGVPVPPPPYGPGPVLSPPSTPSSPQDGQP